MISPSASAAIRRYRLRVASGIVSQSCDPHPMPMKMHRAIPSKSGAGPDGRFAGSMPTAMSPLPDAPHKPSPAPPCRIGSYA